jgi:hypothetical protein
MPIIAKNMIVGGESKTPPTNQPKIQEFKDIRKILEEKAAALANEKPKKDLSKVKHQPQITKQLPKYVAQEDGELTRKINTKSQYMRDIFDLDS